MTKEEFRQEANFLILLIDLTYMQLSVFKDSPFVRQALKQRFSLFWNNARVFSRQMNQVVEKSNCVDEYENESSLLYEVIREASKSKDMHRTLDAVRKVNKS